MEDDFVELSDFFKEKEFKIKNIEFIDEQLIVDFSNPYIKQNLLFGAYDENKDGEFTASELENITNFATTF